MRALWQRDRLIVDAPAMILMLSEAWRAWPNETGGVLLGAAGTNEVRLDVVVGPGPDASHGPCSFAPDSEWQRLRVAEAWEKDHTIEYLGDWHTHPGGGTALSATDRDTLRSIAAYPAARQARPVMLVLAVGRDGSIRIAAQRFAGSKTSNVEISVAVM